MEYAQLPCSQFVDGTFSKAPVPGGGSVASLVAALGTALGGMVCNLTIGKKKFAQYEDDLNRILGQAGTLKDTLMKMIDRDTQNFLPLSRAYGLPSATDEEKAHKEKTMQAALKVAIEVPIDIVRLSYQAIQLHSELVEKSSKLAISDVGCGVACLRASLTSGWLNVVINLNSITDEAYVASIKEELLPLVEKGCALCDKVYGRVCEILGK